MTTVLKSILKPQLRTADNGRVVNKKLAIDVVDKIADELVIEYSNPDFRQWYCGVIYQFGPSKVYEWIARAKCGDMPARLFSKYVKDARSYNATRGVRT